MKPFSVVVPSWKNLKLLDLMYRGLKRNSGTDHELIVFFNECDDECQEWALQRGVRYLGSSGNVGVCAAVNAASKIATTEYICYMNDDMYPLPEWDTALWSYVGMAPVLWLSGTALEAGKSSPCYIGGADYGDSPGNFREEDLLREYASFKRPYNMVSTWTPVLLSLRDWNAVGGFDEDYYPGFGSDPDLAMKFYELGCRHFIGVGTSLVYHFARSTTSRFRDEDLMDPRRHFREKWGIPRGIFLKRMIKRDSVITYRGF